jgi:hypothetical protein
VRDLTRPDIVARYCVDAERVWAERRAMISARDDHIAHSTKNSVASMQMASRLRSIRRTRGRYIMLAIGRSTTRSDRTMSRYLRGMKLGRGVSG